MNAAAPKTASHTPGPWGMETLRTSCGVCHKIGPWPHKWRAGRTMSACIYDDYPSPPEGTDTMLANARLIAAAPDLLSALKSYPSQADGEDAYQFRERELEWWHKIAWPAIAKASA